jgi:Icc-related predicted phosphoesterase
MTKFHILSDLHLEFYPLELPGGDLLILAGDVCEIKNIKLDDIDLNKLDKSGNDVRRKNIAKFFLREIPKYEKVLYVLGNHEHYGGKLNESKDLLEQKLRNGNINNVQVLENESVEIDGILFIGSTLWTDCNKGDPLTIYNLRGGLNDYRYITYHYADANAYNKLRPGVTYRIHMISKEYIAQTLKANVDKPAVVITHHAPSHMSIAPEFAGEYHMNGGFASDLSNMMLDNSNIKCWLHGHTHTFFDYKIGDVRVICNPRGYFGHEKISMEFDANFSVDI